MKKISICLISYVSFFFVSQVTGLYFYLEQKQTKCFSDELVKSSVILHLIPSNSKSKQQSISQMSRQSRPSTQVRLMKESESNSLTPKKCPFLLNLWPPESSWSIMWRKVIPYWLNLCADGNYVLCLTLRLSIFNEDNKQVKT